MDLLFKDLSVGAGCQEQGEEELQSNPDVPVDTDGDDADSMEVDMEGDDDVIVPVLGRVSADTHTEFGLAGRRLSNEQTHQPDEDLIRGLMSYCVPPGPET